MHDSRVILLSDPVGYVRYGDTLLTVDEIFQRLEDQGLDRQFITQWLFSLPVEVCAA